MGGVDDFPDLQQVCEVVGAFCPIVLPRCDGMAVFDSPFFLEAKEGLFSNLSVESGIDFFEVGAKLLPLSSDHIRAAIADLMDETKLGLGLREDPCNGRP